MKISLEVLIELHAKDKPEESVESYDFFLLYTTLTHYTTKKKFSYPIKWCFDKLMKQIFALKKGICSKTNIKFMFTGPVMTVLIQSIFFLTTFISISAIKFISRL